MHHHVLGLPTRSPGAAWTREMALHMFHRKSPRKTREHGLRVNGHDMAETRNKKQSLGNARQLQDMQEEQWKQESTPDRQRPSIAVPKVPNQKAADNTPSNDVQSYTSRCPAGQESWHRFRLDAGCWRGCPEVHPTRSYLLI